MNFKKIGSLVLILALMLSGCKMKEEVPTVQEAAMKEETAVSQEQETSKDSIEDTMEDTKEDEKGEKTMEQTEQDKNLNQEAAACISDKIPAKYFTKRNDHAGTIEHVEYKTYDYFGDKSEITKGAYVYLPFEYDSTKKYNVLYLMHGIGGNDREWGMFDDNSKVKAMMDNLIFYKDIEPFIVVTPNGRSSADFENTNADFNSFYVFGQELRNDLIPFIESTYATYANSKEDGYQMADMRNHRAMAGLSMGGMQTINIGMCECLDILSWFGAFSSAPTSYPAAKIADCLKNFPDDNINYFYAICGREDGIAWNPASAAAKTLPTQTDKLTDGENFMWQEVTGEHNFDVWYLGFYNFAQVVFKDTEVK